MKKLIPLVIMLLWVVPLEIFIEWYFKPPMGVFLVVCFGLGTFGMLLTTFLLNP